MSAASSSLTKFHNLWREPQLKESCKPAGAHPPVAPQPTAAHSRLLWGCWPDLLHLQLQYLGYFPHSRALAAGAQLLTWPLAGLPPCPVAGHLTARLEGLTKFYGVSLLISEQALRNLSHAEQYQIRFLDRVVVKGRNEPLSVYEVLDAELEEVINLNLQTQPDMERGIDLYRQGAFEKAKFYFEQVWEVNYADKTAELYLSRTNYLLERGAPENWDGVWRFTEK